MEIVKHHSEQHESITLTLTGKEVITGSITSREDTSPKGAMHGEAIASEIVDFSLDIDGQKYTATLNRSDYQDNAPIGYVINMKPHILVLRDSADKEVNLSWGDSTKLMSKLEQILKESK